MGNKSVVELIKTLLEQLTPEERVEVFNDYCTYCGDKDPGMSVLE